MKPRLTTTALLLAPLFLGCETKEKPLPEDVYEKGWDETTRSQRVGLLRQDLQRAHPAARLARTRDGAPSRGHARRLVDPFGTPPGADNNRAREG